MTDNKAVKRWFCYSCTWFWNTVQFSRIYCCFDFS